MKIGVLTFHRAHNYGAFLQCYSLVRKISRDFPNCTVEVIDFNSKEMEEYYSVKTIDLIFGRSNIKHINVRGALSAAKQFLIKEAHDISYLQKRKVQAKRFNDSQALLPLSEAHLVSDSYGDFVSFIKDTQYDLIIVGSDAIWNDAQCLIHPNPYFLSKEISAKKVSYAASTYGMMYKTLEEDNKKFLFETLQSFDFIGVRDRETEKYLDFLGNTKHSHTPDPSLFFPFDEFRTSKMIEGLQRKLIESGINVYKPVYAVMGGNWLGKIARSVIGYDQQLVAVYAQNKYADAYIADLNPFEWACMFSLFTATFTSFFHGTIFSLQNGVPTFTVEDASQYGKDYITKTKDLLNRLDLTDYYFTLNDGDITDGIRQHFEDITHNPQATRIAEALEKERRYYEPFKNALKMLGA